MLNLPQANPAFSLCRGRTGGAVSLRITSHILQGKPLAHSVAPMEMEKVEVATTAVTLPWPPHKVSFQPLISSHPAALMFFSRWGWETKVRKELSAVTWFFAHCCYYIKEAAGEIMYAKELCKL